MTSRREVESIVHDCAAAARVFAGARGFYVGGSLAAGDYVAGRSDFDLVALVESRPSPGAAAVLVREHRRLIARRPLAEKLHCVYVPADEAADPSVEHLTWAHQELFRRRLSGIARAELLRFGVTLFGPPPAQALPDVSNEELRDAVREELTGYWADALTKPDLWLEDEYVDLGVLVLARAHVTLHLGSLITKRAALTWLPVVGVPEQLAAEVANRRYGSPAALNGEERERRAVTVRTILGEGIARLTA